MPEGQQIYYPPFECIPPAELSQAAGYMGHMRSQPRLTVQSLEVLCHHSRHCFVLLPVGSAESWLHRLSPHCGLSHHWPGLCFLRRTRCSQSRVAPCDFLELQLSIHWVTIRLGICPLMDADLSPLPSPKAYESFPSSNLKKLCC